MFYIRKQMGGMSSNNVLAEQGEVFQAPDGSIQQVDNNAPSHDENVQINRFGIKPVPKGEGGVVIEADSVLSDSQRQVNSGKRENNIKEKIVKMKSDEGEQIASSLGFNIKLKKSLSPSQLFLKIQQEKDRQTFKILKASSLTQKTRESGNALSANASQLAALPTDEEIYNAIFEYTEEKKEQSGIDFEETTTAQYGSNSSLLDSFGLLPKGQYGEKLKYKYDNKGRKIALLNGKNEVIREIDPVTGRPKYENPFKKVGELLGDAKNYLGKTYDKDGVLGVVDEVMSAPARGVTKAITGKYQDPSEALDIKNPYAKLAVDMVLDPTNLIPVGSIAKGAKMLMGFKNAKKAVRVIDPIASQLLKTAKQNDKGIIDLIKTGNNSYGELNKYMLKNGLRSGTSDGAGKFYKTVDKARKFGTKDAIKSAIPLVNDLINIDKPNANKFNINKNISNTSNLINSNTPNSKKPLFPPNSKIPLKNKSLHSIPTTTKKQTNNLLEQADYLLEKPETSIDSVFLPNEEIYIQPIIQKRPRRHTESIQDYEDSFKKIKTSGQQSFELNDDYIQRLHQENVRGIKQTPKLIRNQYGGASLLSKLNLL